MTAIQTAPATMQIHDDLAALLARNLTLGSAPASIPVLDTMAAGEGLPGAFVPGASSVSAVATLNPEYESTPEPAVASTAQPKIIYSISQHYTHSAHVKPAVNQTGQTMQFEQPQQQEVPAPQQASEQQQQSTHPSIQRPFSGPPLSENQAAEFLLIRNGIDPTALSPVQIALFKMSTLDRRDYLLKLWKESPPVPGTSDEDTRGSWGEPSSVERETFLAQMRMHHQQQQQQQYQQRQQELLQQQHQLFQQSQQFAEDVGMSINSAPDNQQSFGQAADSRWPQANTYMEPYMMSGYEDLSQPNQPNYQSSPSPVATMDGVNVPRDSNSYSHFSTATDPVYNNRLAQPATMTLGNRASWPSQYQASVEMENQYGALMAMRESSAMEF